MKEIKKKQDDTRRARPKRLTIRLSENEYAALKGKVEKSGMSQQAFLIKAITEKEVVNTDGVKVIVPHLKRIGNNINQIARSCNEGNQASYAVVVQMERELKEVWQLLRQLVAGRASETP